jgi:hypothetical protein
MTATAVGARMETLSFFLLSRKGGKTRACGSRGFRFFDTAARGSIERDRTRRVVFVAFEKNWGDV